MTDFKHILFEKADEIGFISLNRPEYHNAMDAIMISELSSILNEIHKDPSYRAVVIRGKGKSFSSGADLNYMQSLISSSKRENLEDAVTLAGLFDLIYNCPLPVISIAHGNVFGGAIGILAASDIVYCSDTAKLSFSELKLGLIPSTISPYIIQKIGESKSAELFFSCRSFSGTEAFDFGLANKTVSESELDATLNAFLNELRMSAPGALSKTKLLIRSVSGKEIDSEIRRFTSRVIAEVRISDEAQEGMKAFLEKRKPNWSK